MVRKFFLSFDSKYFAMKYDPNKKSCTIGGPGGYLSDYRFIAENWFGIKKYKEIWTQKNKVRLVMIMSEIKFDETLNYMTDIMNVSITITKSHGRIMR